MEREHQGASQFHRLGINWRDNYHALAANLGHSDEDDMYDLPSLRACTESLVRDLGHETVKYDQILLTSMDMVAFLLSKDLLLLKMSRLLELRADKLEALKSTVDQLTRLKKEFTCMREAEATARKQEGGEGKNARQKDKQRVGAGKWGLGALLCAWVVGCRCKEGTGAGAHPCTVPVTAVFLIMLLVDTKLYYSRFVSFVVDLKVHRCD